MDIIYVLNVSNNYIKMKVLKIVQYVDKKTGLNIMSIYVILMIFRNELLWVYYFIYFINYLYFIIIVLMWLILFKLINIIIHTILFILL